MNVVYKLIEGKNKKGIGLTLLLLALLITPWGAFLLSLYRSLFPKLRNVPKWLITNKISLGSAGFWGAVILTFGICIYWVEQRNVEAESAESSAIFLRVFVWPVMLTGFFLILEQITYTSNMAAINMLLDKIMLKQKLTKAEATFEVKNVRYRYQHIHGMLEDLQKNDIIKFTKEAETGDFLITITHPLLKSQAIKVQKTEQWVCDSCGAQNVYTVCEYCGTEKQ